LDKEKILKTTDSIILIFLTVQIFSVTFSIALSSISFGIWGGLWIMQMIYTRKLDIPESISKDLKILVIFIFLFFVTDLYSRYFAIIPDGAYVGLKRFTLYLIFFGTIIKTKDRETLNKIIVSILIVFTVISLYEISLYFMKFSEEAKTTNIGEIRLYAFSFFITTGEIKMLILMLLFPLLFIKEEIFLPKRLLAVPLSIIFVSMYLTQSRNVFLAVVICFFLFGIFINRKFLIYLSLSIALILIIIPSGFRQRITSIVDPKHPSNESRLIMWNVGWQMFKDHPITGVGDNEITQVYKMYKQPEFHGEGSHLHSNYFMVLATKGIFGIIFYIALFFTLFLKHFKYFKRAEGKEEKYMIFGSILAMVSFHISGIFEWNYGDWEVLTVFLFVISVPFLLEKLRMQKLNTINQTQEI
jgi:O-antigen ligase